MQMIKRTEQIWIRPNKQISTLCHLSKNLYNEANYIIRQTFFKEGKWVRNNQLDKLLKDSENYKTLPVQSSQQTLRMLDNNWLSFFRAKKEYNKHPEKFLGEPKIPGYKNKDGENVLIFTNQQIKIRDGYLVFPKKTGVKIKTRIKTGLNQVRIIPKGVGYVCEVIYEKNIKKNNKKNKNRIVGIDLGNKNIITMVNNIGIQPIVIKDDGNGIKSINQFYNKKKADFQSIYDLQNIKDGKKMRKLRVKRDKKVNDYTHKLSRWIIGWCKEHNIGTIVFGYNKEWKQNINMGRKTNQCFTMIPFMNIIHKTRYKAEEENMKVIEHEENHTSKCSFLDNESIRHHRNYVGKRVSRDFFRSKSGKLIHADVNAGYNIMVKAIPEAIPLRTRRRIGGCGLHPVRYNLLYSNKVFNGFYQKS